jgi:protein-S-isoprenylcysteine O-methyltransferase Ste14
MAAAAFAVLMVGSLIVAVVYPEIAGGPTKDVPLSGLGDTTDDNTWSAWLRAAAGFGLVAVWMAVLVFQLRKARRQRTPPAA